MKSALLANLGFVLQVSGIFIILPIAVSFIFSETSATIGLFLAAITFLVLGFLLNSICEKKELNFKQSCTLIVVVFISLSLIGALPYLYVNISPGADVLQLLTDSIFESTSGFTTTGFSVIDDLTILPKSIILYRALTQFIGGIGIVLIILAFFYPEAKLKELSRSLGFGEQNKIKKTFYSIISIYCIFTISMIILGYLAGYTDILNLVSFIFSAVSTGGFSPIANISEVMTSWPLNLIILISILLGATNFVFLNNLLSNWSHKFLKGLKLLFKKPKEFFELFKSLKENFNMFSLKKIKIFNYEFKVFIIISIISIIIGIILFNLTPYDAIFHILSAVTTTGFSYLPVEHFSDGLKIFLTLLIFVGGTSLSTAGGIKTFRLILMLKIVKKAITDIIKKEDSKVQLFGKEYSNAELIQSLVFVFLFTIVIVVSTLIVSACGFTAVNAAFEVTSAMSNTGVSVGIVSPTLSLPLKWLFVAIMILGRVDIISVIVMLSRIKEFESDKQLVSHIRSQSRNGNKKRNALNH